MFNTQHTHIDVYNIVDGAASADLECSINGLV